MIKRVYGKLNDLEIELMQNGEFWEVVVPKMEEGKYYVDLYVEDYAGNTSFIAVALFEVDATCTCVNFSILQDCLIVKDSIFSENITVTNYDLEVVECNCLS